VQIEQCDSALAEVLERLYGPVDRVRLGEIRDADRMAPYNDSFRENDLPTITRNLVRALYDRDVAEPHLEEILQVRFDSFVACIRPTPGVDAMLMRLRQRYRVGLVSNYPDGEAIRASVQRVALRDILEVVVASGDVGCVKPDPLPFTTALRHLNIRPEEAVYVGDNWLADVQGAKRLGMQSVLTRQFQSPERFDAQPGDHEPDLIINHLSELEALLLASAIGDC
jgi:HAD superfamily hydrolase (TIGR01549 family)